MANALDVIVNFVVRSANSQQTLNGLTDAVKGFSVAMTAAGVAMAKVSLDASTKFSEAMGNIASVTLDSKKAIGEMSEEIKRFVNMNLSATATEAAQAMYEIRSAGISAKDSMTALNDVITASKGTGADFGDTARTLAGIVNAYGREVISTTEAGDIFVKTIQDGVTTGQELASTLGNITGIAAAAGVSFNEIGAAIATLTQSGIGTSEAITGLKATISTILKPSKEAADLFDKLGISYGATALQSKGLSGVIKEISDKTGGNVDAMAKLIPSVEALNTVLSLAKDGASKFTEELGKMSPATGAAADSASKVAEQYADAVKKLGVAFDLLKINIGENLAEALTPFIVELTKLLQRFNDLSPEVRNLIIDLSKWAFFVGAAATALIGLNFAIKGFVGLGLAGIVTSASTAFTTLAITMGSTQLAITAIVAPILAVASAVYTVVQSFRMLDAEIKKDQAWTDIQKGYNNAAATLRKYRQETNNLKDTSKLTAQQQRELAHAARTVAADMKEGSKQQKELLEVSKKFGALASKELNFPKPPKIPTVKPPPDTTDTNTKNTLNKKTKQQEDYKNDVNRIMEGLAQDEAKRTLDDLNYKVWAENKKYLEEKATIEKAIKLKQATNAQLKALEKEHQIAITNLYMDAQAEQDKIDKENKDKEKAKQKDATEKQKKDAQDLADKLNQIEEKRLNEIDQLRTQFLEKQKASTLNLASNYIESFSKLSPELGKTAKEFLGIFTNVSNASKAYDENIKVINEKTQLTQEEAKAYDDANKALKENKGLTEEQINNNKKIIEDTKTKIQLNEKAKESLINLAKGDLEAVSKDIFVYAIGQAVEGSVNLVNIWTKYNEKLKETKTPLTDYTNMLKEQVDAIPPLLAFLKIGPALSGWLTNMFIGDKAKIEEALNKKAEADKTLNEETQKEIAANDARLQDKILAKREDIIQKAYETEQEAIKKTFRLKKETAEKSLKFYEDEIDKLKSNIRSIDDELAKRQQKRAQSQETATAFQARRALLSSTLPADFARTPIDKFEIESASQEEQLKQSFALGQMSIDQLNKHLMDLAVKKNLFYERIANSLVVGTKEHLDFQKKANDAYGEYASLQQITTDSQLKADKENLQSQLDGFKSLKDTELKNIQDIENAQTNALIRLESKWKTPAGAFKLSMDEAVLQVVDKMNAELSNFIGRAKQAIYNFSGQIGKAPTGEETITRNRQLGEATGKKYYTQSELTSYENKIIAEQEKRTQQLAIENAKRQAFTQSGGMLGGLGGKSFPGFATGGIFDSNKGFGAAMLHDNEMILNPFQQKNLFNLLAAGGGGINVTINTGAVNSMADINKIASAVSQVIRTDYLRR